MSDLESAILEAVNDMNYVSFAQLNQIDGFQVPDDSESCHGLEIAPNTLLWYGMTKEGSDAVIRLLDEHKIAIAPTDTLVYLIDGECLTLPIANGGRKGGYAKPHWLPVTLCRASDGKVQRGSRWLIAHR